MVLNPTLSFAGKTIWDGGNPIVQDRIGTNRATGARYYPFGDEITSTANDATKFGTYRRDGFTGLDYADQRYYASGYGRFNSPDPYQAAANGANDASTPEIWNKYAYVQGDPVNWYDPQGLFLLAPDPIDNCPPGTVLYNGVCVAAVNDGAGKGLPNGGGGGGGGSSSTDISKPYSESIKCNETPAQLIAAMESNFGSFANYSGTFGPLGLPAASASVQFSGAVALGSTISITDINTIFVPTLTGIFPVQVQTVAVQVTAVSSTGFTFTTLPGHVLFPATISFTATAGANGQLAFGINVNGNFSSPISEALYYAGGYSLENNIWNNVLANVQKDCSK